VDERFGDRPDLAADIRLTLGLSMFARYRLEAAEQQALPLCILRAERRSAR
jgi:hypothetical protein